MRFLQRDLILGIVLALVPIGSVVFASPASADCNNAGYATVCAQGTVTGGSNTPPVAGPVYPGYCADPWYCNDDWGIDISIDRPNRPNRPGGGGGGIGPRN
jgi:hypothetical protein